MTATARSPWGITRSFSTDVPRGDPAPVGTRMRCKHTALDGCRGPRPRLPQLWPRPAPLSPTCSRTSLVLPARKCLVAAVPSHESRLRFGLRCQSVCPHGRCQALSLDPSGCLHPRKEMAEGVRGWTHMEHPPLTWDPHGCPSWGPRAVWSDSGTSPRGKAHRVSLRPARPLAHPRP